MTGRPARDDEFASFVDSAFVGLVRFGTLLVGDRAGGEDLAQTALMKVYGVWPRINDKAAAGAYTRRVMIRVAAQGRRRRWNGERPTAIESDGVVDLDRSDEVAVALAVYQALAALPLAQRAVLVLRYYEGWSEAEIAEMLGVSVGTVKSRAARGLAALRGTGLLVCDGMKEEVG